MSSEVIQQIQDVVEFLEPRISVRPEIAIVLGSGLGGFAERIETPTSISYRDIPHFQPPSVDGHEGRIVFGTVGGVPVAVLQGRWHFYEGHSMNSIVIPTRALAGLGAHTMFLTNAAEVILDKPLGDVWVSDHAAILINVNKK